MPRPSNTAEDGATTEQAKAKKSSKKSKKDKQVNDVCRLIRYYLIRLQMHLLTALTARQFLLFFGHAWIELGKRDFANKRG